MTKEEHQATVDIAKLAATEYFDHYLTDIFPDQMERLFQSHNQDIQAHPVQFEMIIKTRRKVDRVFWMAAGIASLVTALGAIGSVVYYWYHSFHP